jgi:hypothetical protein
METGERGLSAAHLGGGAFIASPIDVVKTAYDTYHTLAFHRIHPFRRDSRWFSSIDVDTGHSARSASYLQIIRQLWSTTMSEDNTVGYSFSSPQIHLH